jgi:hypothetical protein
LALGPIQLSAVETLHDADIIRGDMLPLQGQNLAGTHAGE